MEYEQIEDKMQKAIDYLCEELAGIRAGRANPAILNKVTVEYYGTNTIKSNWCYICSRS